MDIPKMLNAHAFLLPFWKLTPQSMQQSCERHPSCPQWATFGGEERTASQDCEQAEMRGETASNCLLPMIAPSQKGPQRSAAHFQKSETVQIAALHQFMQMTAQLNQQSCKRNLQHHHVGKFGGTERAAKWDCEQAGTREMTATMIAEIFIHQKPSTSAHN